MLSRCPHYVLLCLKTFKGSSVHERQKCPSGKLDERRDAHMIIFIDND